MTPWATLDDAIAHNVATDPDGWAYIEPGGRISWAAYDGYITLLANRLVEAGLEPGDRVGVRLGDGAAVHVALGACLRAGVVAVGIGARSGPREARYLLETTGARTLLTETRRVADLSTVERPLLVDQLLPPLDGEVTTAPAADRGALAGRHLDPAGLCLINSTSGTTGRPKCVAHSERRWILYHDYASDSADLSRDDVLMSAVPAPFGFGLWSAHFTPTLLGCPVVVLPRFDVREMVRLLVSERVTVLNAVTTQFILMLGLPDLADHDLSALRILMTGGEAIPYERAREFEERTGATVVTMYGSNETGALSYTTPRDPPERRLSTVGRVIDAAEVRLFDPDGRAELSRGDRPGRPAARGDLCSLGYYNDDAANRELYTVDGWLLMGDLVTIDPDGYVRLVGRTSDIIIRGGKNISAAAVEEEVGTHPAVLRCAAVAMPDPVFGERVCVFVVPRAGRTVDLPSVLAHLTARGVSREWFPERLEVVGRLPTSEGGKVAKAALRKRLRGPSGAG